ncbi:hypothetical protein B0T16DRAFT_338672 [Cercophora newfieldiana]|uniref:C2H2-type domain-containing protein n=1 Tax=Cercophora newfieldiana TaxID=92897 RepID=A0AA40CI29_9PEZI|nr:hypothetical protein B0T16DRAFT_338672 [Cercophora newfieldiana]
MDQISGKPSPSESLLSKRKAAIIERSMAELERHLDQWLNNPAATAPMTKRPPKRARVEDPDSGTEDNSKSPVVAVVERSGSSKAAQKRTKRELLRRFACPFAKHNPSKFKNVKTCCGPGWTGVHRVKEHLYRCHQLKNTCNRCAEAFDDAKGLKEHQRAATPCQLRDDASADFITEEQEKLLRGRAKPGSEPEENWVEMYRVIFPEAKEVPSPWYDTAESEVAKAGEEPPRFKDVEEYKAHVKQEVMKAVKPMLAMEVERALQTVEANVVQKAVDFVNALQTRFFRTWNFQAEQAGLVGDPVTPAETEPDEGVAGGVAQGLSSVIEPLVGDVQGLYPDFLMLDGAFNWGPWLEPGMASEVVECVDGDSGYMTSSVDGGGSWAGGYA